MFFCIKILCINPKHTWQPLLPSTKGLSFTLCFYFMLESRWSSPFPFSFYPLACSSCLKDHDIYPIGCKLAWSIIVDITQRWICWEATQYAPIFLSVWLKLHNHKYCASVSNYRRLQDSWVCELAEKLYCWLFLVLRQIAIASMTEIIVC